MFGRPKSKEKLIKEIEEKKLELKKLLEENTSRSLKKAEKLKEEINTMVKLGLKDGRLQAIDDTPQGQPQQTMPQGQPQQMMPQQPIAEDPFMGQHPQQMMPRQSPMEWQAQPQPQPVMPQADWSQQIPPQMPMQPQMTRQAANMYQQMYEQQIPPQQMVQPPILSQRQNIPEVSRVVINLYGGSVLPVEVAGDKLEQFLERLSEAIDNQASIQIGNRVVNGRYILEYEF